MGHLGTKISNGKDDFQKHAKKYVINMFKNQKTIHIKNGCKDSQCIYEYADFNTLKEIKDIPLTFRYCEKCFENQEEVK